ncbi:hypothetical protein YC2023_075977 [Brassica napus]
MIKDFRIEELNVIFALSVTRRYFRSVNTAATKLRRVPEEAKLKYGEGLSQRDSEATQRNQGTILQVSKTLFSSYEVNES